MHEWLDPTTRAILSKATVNTTAAIETSAYSLLLLEKGSDETRVEETVAAIQQGAPTDLGQFPFVLARRMSFVDALAGQFALACCDCVSAILPDETIDRADRGFLRELYAQVMKSADYEFVHVQTYDVPPTDEGRRFCWQFFGLAVGLPGCMTSRVFQIKADLMEHWADKSGVSLRILP